MKTLLLFLFTLVAGSVFACDCNWWPFCDNYTGSDEEYIVLLVKLTDNFELPNSERADKYYDVEIVDQLFGFPVESDSLTIVYRNTSCDVAIESFTDTVILRMLEFEKDAHSNYPVFTPFTCLHNTLYYENDIVSGNISKVDSITPWRSNEQMPFEEFLLFYEYECSQGGRFFDLDELKGVEIIPNPILDFLRLRNNLDVSVTFSIFDCVGKPIKNGEIEANSIREFAVHDLPSGVYFVRIDDGIGYKFHKVLKH